MEATSDCLESQAIGFKQTLVEPARSCPREAVFELICGRPTVAL